MRVLLGRSDELEQVRAAIVGAPTRSATVVIEGEAGIGKTSLVAEAVRAATSHGHRVVLCRPTPAETGLAFAALADLLAGDDLQALGDVARTAIEVALGRREGAPPLVHELGAAVVEWVEAAAADGRALVVVVDDVQWLDQATLDVLRHALRRLPASGVCVLVAQRMDGAAGAAAASTITPLERTWLRLAPLRAAAMEQLVHSVAGALPLHVVERVVQTAGGNPLHGIELARSLRAVASVDPGRPLRVPPSLAALMGDRLAELPADAVDAVAAVALASHPTVSLLDRLGLLEALGPAEVADVVEVDGRDVRCRHPLIASAAHDALPVARRLALHRRLAEVTSGIERCRHLALAATDTDADLAREVEEGMRLAAARGGVAEAADLAQLAVGATPDDDPARWGRFLSAADAMFRAGRTDDAVALVQRVIDGEVPVSLLARAWLAMSTIEYSRTDDAGAAATAARRVLELTDDAALLSEAHTILSRVEYTDFAVAAHHAAAALELIRGRDDVAPKDLAQAISAAANARFMAGFGLDRAAFEQAMALEAGTGVAVSDSAFACFASHLKYADELAESEAMFLDLASRSDPGSLPYALGHLPQLLIWAGRWDEADDVARRHLQLAGQTGQDSQVATARYNLALLAAYRGDVESAEPLAREIYEAGRDGHVRWNERSGAGLLGFLAMNRGDAEEAARMFERYHDLTQSMRLGEPGYHRFHGDHVEAMLAIGEVERAEQLDDDFAPTAIRLARPSALAMLHRGRSLVAANRGDRDGALAAADRALDALAGTALDYERARSHLTLGIVARRFGERTIARESLGRALERFESMGAGALAERVRRELARVSGRAAGAPTSQLTSSERSVAELAAAGRTTRQIAAELFISMKTVEANLTRVYRKLDVANRAQLANRLAEE